MSGVLRSIFSPLVKALQKPSTYLAGGPIFVADTGVTFLKLEADIISIIKKESVKGQFRFAFVPFSSWKNMDQVLKFYKFYLKLEIR